MQDAVTQKNRKPLSNIKTNKLNTINLNSNHFIQAYATFKKCKSKQDAHKPKGKENRKRKDSMQTETFPDFVIKFKEPIHANQKINLQKRVSLLDNQLLINQSFGKLKLKHFDEQNRPKLMQPVNKINCNVNNSELKISNKHTTKHYYNQFKQAICKIYKGLDIFDRGTISQTNINKWIPQSALYFLGSIFQKIRVQRLNLSQKQFMQLCQTLLGQSNQQDIKWFIEDVNGKECAVQVVPIVGQIQQSNCGKSPSGQKRTQRLENKVDCSSNSKDVAPFVDIINGIKQKQRQLDGQLKELLQKQKKINISSRQDNYQVQNSADKQILSHRKRIQYDQNEKMFNKIMERNAIITHFIGSAEKQHRATDKMQKQFGKVQHFTFKLPIESPRSPLINEITFNSDKKYEQRSNRKLSQLQIDQNESMQRPRTSRIVRQTLNLNQNKELICSSKRSSASQCQSQRIDKLSSKLEQYIKFNKQKIQQNKRFIRQNSVAKH